MSTNPDSPLAAFRAKYGRGLRCVACGNPGTRPLDALYTLAAVEGEPLRVAAMRCDVCGRVQLFAVDVVSAKALGFV